MKSPGSKDSGLFLWLRFINDEKMRIFNFGFLISFLLLGCSSTNKHSAFISDGDWPERVIDAHTHVHFTGKKSETASLLDTEEERLKEFEDAKVVGSIAHASFERREDRDFKRLKAVPCFGVSKKPNLVVLEKAVRSDGYRCFKIYLGYEHQAATHPNYMRVYALARKYQVPVVFHTGDTLDPEGLIKYADPLAIDEVAVKFRDVKFVIAHLGNPWIQTAAEVIYKNKNVYGDVSALLVGDLEMYEPEQLEEYVVKPIRWAWGYVEDPSKLMYGSDWPLVNTGAYIRVVKKAVPKEHWDRFFYQNAVDVFGNP